MSIRSTPNQMRWTLTLVCAGAAIYVLIKELNGGAVAWGIAMAAALVAMSVSAFLSTPGTAAESRASDLSE
ncbi:hypothetical protein ABMA10_19385 [Plantibacter sp. RU18]